MRWLLKMVDIAKHPRWKQAKLFFIHDEGGENKERDFTKEDIAEFFAAVESCQPFVFEQPLLTDFKLESEEINNEIERLIPMVDQAQGGEEAPQAQEIVKRAEVLRQYFDDFPCLSSAPFPVFSIECLNDPLTISGQLFDTQFACVLAREIGPGDFRIWNLLAVQKNNPTHFIVSRSTLSARMVDAYLQSMNSMAVGNETTKQRIKIGNGDKKRIVDIRRVVRVCPKKARDSIRTLSVGEQISWSHRWLTRGHWRTHTGGLGKDRSGNYCVPNATWVVEHTKGPEDALLISKTRKVVGSDVHPLP